MVTVHLTVIMRSVPILSFKWSVSIDTMLNFDGDGHSDGDGDGTREQTFNMFEMATQPLDLINKSQSQSYRVNSLLRSIHTYVPLKVIVFLTGSVQSCGTVHTFR